MTYGGGSVADDRFDCLSEDDYSCAEGGLSSDVYQCHDLDVDDLGL